MGRLEIDWVKTIAGALAAVLSAVLLSTLGAAGTLVGAALGSLVVTVGGAVLTQGLATSKETLSKAQASALQKVGIAQAEVERAGRAEDGATRGDRLDHAEQRLAEANRELDDASRKAAPSTPFRDRLAALPWKRILLGSLGLFVAALVLITAFELVAGRSVSAITGGTSDDRGTTIGDVSGRDSGGNDRPGRDDDDPKQPAEPTDGSTPTREPSPTEHSTPTPSAPSAPTESPSSGPTESPDEADELDQLPSPSASP